MSAVVVMGEAPESEDENDELDCAHASASGNSFSVQLIDPSPETPPSPSPSFPPSKEGPSTRIQPQPSTSPSSSPLAPGPGTGPGQGQGPGKDDPSSTVNGSGSSHPFDSLLHRKLRERNELLREELVRLANGPYLSATKEIDSLSHQLTRSQRMVQQVSGTLTKLTRDLKNLELTLDSCRDASSLIPPFN